MSELYHHGILGQKWGVRRFQNPDGTLTEAGKKRYGVNRTPDGSMTEAGKKRYENDTSKKKKKELDSAVKDCKKELASLYAKREKLINAMDDEDFSITPGSELDSVTKQIDSLIEGDYAKAVFDKYAEEEPILIISRTGEEVLWRDAFGKSLDDMTPGDKHSLVYLIEGGGYYQLKKKSDDKHDDLFSEAGKIGKQREELDKKDPAGIVGRDFESALKASKNDRNSPEYIHDFCKSTLNKPENVDRFVDYVWDKHKDVLGRAYDERDKYRSTESYGKWYDKWAKELCKDMGIPYDRETNYFIVSRFLFGDD